MRIEGILLSYDTYPEDRGRYAVIDARKLLKHLETVLSFRDIKPKLIPRPDGVNGYILIDLRETISNISETELDSIRRDIIVMLHRIFDSGEILEISRARILHKICKTTIEDIVKATQYFRPLIDGTWRINLRTRKLLDRRELIVRVARNFNMPVDLHDPQYSLNIEVLGSTYTAIYLIKKGYENEVIIRY